MPLPPLREMFKGLVFTENEGVLLLLPPSGAPSHNLEALTAWHRARGGVTLLVLQSRWTGIAAVDRSLVPAVTEDAWTLAGLHALSPTRAITFASGQSLQIAWLDRDGTIIEDRDYLAEPEGVALLPGAAAGLRLLAENRVKLVVVSNQSGVGQGRITLPQLRRVNTRMEELLAGEGVTLDGIYSCVHPSEMGCECRKPRTGLVRQAEAELGLSPGNALVVGDKSSDLGLARALNVPAFLVTTGYGSVTLADRSLTPDYVVDGLDQLARICSHPEGLPVEVPLPLT